MKEVYANTSLHVMLRLSTSDLAQYLHVTLKLHHNIFSLTPPPSRAVNNTRLPQSTLADVRCPNEVINAVDEAVEEVRSFSLRHLNLINGPALDFFLELKVLSMLADMAMKNKKKGAERSQANGDGRRT